MKKTSIAAALLLAACSPAAEETAPPTPSWADDVAGYCEAQGDRWLANLVDRIDRAMPSGFAQGSLRYEGLNLQAPFDGADGVKELQLRLEARRDGQLVDLSAYGQITPGDCDLRGLEVIEGFDRFDPPLRFAVPA